MPTHLVFLREQMGYQSLRGDSSQKLSSFKANVLLPTLCKQLLLVPFWALISFKRFRITVAVETSQIMFACMAAAQPTAKPSMPSFCKCAAGPPALHHLPHRKRRDRRWTCFSLTVRGTSPEQTHQFLFSPFLILCMQMSNFCFKSFPLYSTRVMWCPILPMAWSTTSTRADTPSFCKSRCLDPEKL